MTEEGAKFLAKKIGASLDQIEKINLKEDFSVKLKNGKVEHIDLDNLGPIVRPSCLACTDFSNYSADISVGGVGSPKLHNRWLEISSSKTDNQPSAKVT
jgi:coenzyme F420-reducing hydrogenase beta subunit